MSVYAPVRVIYSWVNDAAGRLNISPQYLAFNILVVVGLTTLVDGLFGLLFALLAFHAIQLGGMFLIKDLGFDLDLERLERFKIRVAWVVGLLVFSGLTPFLLFEFITDPHGNDFATKNSLSEFWFFALVGAAVLIATYAFFVKRLLNELKSLTTRTNAD